MTNRKPSPTRQKPTERVISQRRRAYNAFRRRALALRPALQQKFPFAGPANDR